MRGLGSELADRRSRGLYRQRRVIEGPQQPWLVVDGRQVLSFCSNDYLGLANHPRVIQAFREAALTYGVGSGAAHLVTGHMRPHHALEEALAQLTSRPRALLFSTGYMANLGAVSALVGHGDAVFEDRLNHASLLDAGLLSGARFARYQHGDTEDLDRRLGRRSSSGRRLVLTDGVFSMDGDLAPLRDLAAIARRHEAWLMVDDAHGLGVLGHEGRGTLAQLGLSSKEVPVLVGTLGKAFGTAGAFVAGDDDLIELLIQAARTYIYTTAQPAAIAEATRVSLEIARREAWRRERLQALIARLRDGAAQLDLPLMASETPIQPLLVGDTGLASQLSDALLSQGLMVSAIRPPTVPEGTARLRITLSAAHEEADVDRLLQALATAWQQLRLEG